MPRLVVVTDRSQLRLGRGLASHLEAAARAGLTHVVLRELDLDDSARVALADRLRTVGLTVVAAHRSLPSGTGLHLPASAPAPAPGAACWGRSCHRRDDVLRAAQEGARWATLSPYAATGSKPGHGPPLPGTAYADLPIPTYALGGITPDNAAAARAAGSYGVAVMGAVMRAADPAPVVERLLDAVTG